MKNALIWVVAIVSVIFIVFLLTAPKTEQANLNNAPTADRLEDGTEDIIENADIENKPALIIGDPEAKVTIVEYGDFKCPSCNSFHHQAGAEIRQVYVDTGLANIEFRNYPFLGPDSGRAARGAYCANDQGVFTEYHDKAYNYIWDNNYSSGDYSAEFQDIFTPELLTDLLKDDLKDEALFRSCIGSTDYNRFIDADLLLGAEDEITGTPGFIVGGQKITGPSNFNTFKTLIDIQLR